MGLMDKLPKNLSEYIKNDGTSVADGYIRFLKEEGIEEIRQIVETSEIWQGGIPFATTAFGDILAWEDGYVMLYKFTDEDYTVMLSGTDFFFPNLKDEEYQKDFLDMELFFASIDKMGEINDDECYTLEPIPRIGGARDIRYVNIGKLKEYLTLIV